MNSLIEDINRVREIAQGFTILINKTSMSYKYGKNPFADMLIENSLYCDLYPEKVKNPNDFYGFNRSLYTLSD